MFLGPDTDLHRVGNHQCCLLPGHGGDFPPRDGHRRLPAEDVSVEAEIVCGDEHPPVYQDVLL